MDAAVVSIVMGSDSDLKIMKEAAKALEEFGVSYRSEERRVGKECEVPCRSRWSPYH